MGLIPRDTSLGPARLLSFLTHRNDANLSTCLSSLVCMRSRYCSVMRHALCIIGADPGNSFHLAPSLPMSFCYSSRFKTSPLLPAARQRVTAELGPYFCNWVKCLGSLPRLDMITCEFPDEQSSWVLTTVTASR